MKKIAINGFGRIGRTVLRTLLEKSLDSQIDVVAINLGPSKPDNLALLFAYDSLMGPFPGTVTSDEKSLVINGKTIALFSEKDPANLPWKQLSIDAVVESSGAFTDGETAQAHLAAGAKKVLITAPAKNAHVTIIIGVNDQTYDQTKHHIISLGSCTTNCFAPVIKVLLEALQLRSGLMTTIHSYTNDQVLLDIEHKDPRRARAATLNMIPTKTGAKSLIAKIFPDLAGSIDAVAIRVPTPTVSLLDFSFVASKPLSVDAINNAFKIASTGRLKHIMQYEDKPLVSSDFKGSSASCIIDSLLTQATGSMGKVFAWYDNEYGYSCRVRDFLLLV